MKTIIPKDCFLCDHCNNALSDDKFIALEDCVILGEEICAKRCEIYEKYQAEEIDEQGLQECRDTHEQEIYRKDLIGLFDSIVDYWDNNMNKVFTRPKDILVADAIIELIRTREMIENFNKKALYLLIR